MKESKTKRLLIREGNENVVIPMSKSTYELLSWSAACTGCHKYTLVKRVLAPKCEEAKLSFSYKSLSQLARMDDRDVLGYVDILLRKNIKVKISDFLALPVTQQDLYLKWARENVSLQVTGIINALLSIGKGYRIDLSAPDGLVQAIKRNQQ
jgi:hypothetical protein